MKKKPIKIRISKLGRQKADGLAYKDDRLIILDPRLKGINFIETFIHEVIHCQQPDLSEEAVTEFAKEMADLAWKIGIRWTDHQR